MAEIIMTVEEIQKLIPHRYPFLLVDRVVALDPGKSIVAVKNVTMNEPHFTGHFPGHPVMPGVLIIEAMAQASALMVAKSFGDGKSRLVYFMTIESAKFRKPVVPGDTLHLHVQALQNRRNVWKCSGEARVDGQKVAEAVLSAMIGDVLE